MNGIELIAAERERQQRVEGWSAEHDDQHARGDMTAAAVAYGMVAMHQLDGSSDETSSLAAKNSLWPWDEEWWKPSADSVRNLVKAGALIAAEIDRLQRTK